MHSLSFGLLVIMLTVQVRLTTAQTTADTLSPPESTTTVAGSKPTTTLGDSSTVPPGLTTTTAVITSSTNTSMFSTTVVSEIQEIWNKINEFSAICSNQKGNCTEEENDLLQENSNKTNACILLNSYAGCLESKECTSSNQKQEIEAKTRSVCGGTSAICISVLVLVLAVLSRFV